MSKNEWNCILISDFTIDSLAGYLNNGKEFPSINAIAAPFDQVRQVFLDENLKCWQDKYDFAVVWTQPEKVLESFNHILDFRNTSINTILGEVDEFCSLVTNIQNRVGIVFIPTWVLPTSYHNEFGMLDMKNETGPANILMRMNLRLVDNLSKFSNFYFLNTRTWIEVVGKKAFNPKLWYMAKVAFGNEVFQEAAKDIKTSLQSLSGQSRKLIIVDLDNTLWGDIVGDVGWENINLGGHSYIGEAFVDFQKTLRSFVNRGILLAIVSKNEESVALEAINNHPEMVLRSEDFVGWKINWGDKAENIIDLVSELNLGFESVVFIDDNPVERARVREALPDVYVPEMPEDKMLYNITLLGLRCFGTPSVTKEDMNRTKMYVSGKKRVDLRNSVKSLDEWLKTLQTRVKIEELNRANLQRTIQLLNKTNQMNLSTRRLNKSELESWVKEKNHFLWTFCVSDKFGDSGLTGIISMEADDVKGEIVDFVLSCRVMGRKIEDAMLGTVLNYGQTIGLNEVYANYVPSDKNKPCLEFLKKSGFNSKKDNNTFVWQLGRLFSVPDVVQIEQFRSN